MKKWIVSVVMAKTTPGAVGVDAKGNVGRMAPDISIQNVVGVCSAEDSNDAWSKFKPHAKLQHPDHNIVVKVIIAADEADLME